MTGVCLFVCVVGPGFDLTSPAFVRSRASQAAGSDGRLAKKRNRAPISWSKDCVETILQMPAAFQPRAGCVFLEGHHHSCRSDVDIHFLLFQYYNTVSLHTSR